MQDCLETAIRSAFPQLNISKATMAKLKRLCLGFIFRAHSAKYITDAFRGLLGSKKLRMIDFRNDLLSDGYLMKNVKLWMYYSIANGRRKDFAEMFAIKEADVGLRKYLDEKTSKHLERLVKKGYPAQQLKKFDHVSGRVLQSLTPTIGKFVNRKMKFIQRQQKMSCNDLVLQLQAEGFKSLMHYYPAIASTVHVENIIKRHIHNRGVNVMQAYATVKRSQYTREKDGSFTSKVISLNTEYAIKQTAQLINEENSDTELKITVLRLLSSYSGKRRHFLFLLMGTYDTGFTAYLAQQGISMPNDVYFDRLNDLDKYIRLALGYLDVPYEAGLRFVEKLQYKLAA